MFRRSSSNVCKCLVCRASDIFQKFIKWCTLHVQLTTWCCRCDESKHDEVAFLLAEADFGSNSLWQTSYLKDISWMCILNQYHKASSLKAWTAMCQSEKKSTSRLGLISVYRMKIPQVFHSILSYYILLWYYYTGIMYFNYVLSSRLSRWNFNLSFLAMYSVK